MMQTQAKSELPISLDESSQDDFERAVQTDELQRFRLNFLAQQARRALLGGIPLWILLVWLLHATVPWSTVGSFAAVSLGLLLLRALGAHAMLRWDDPAASRPLREGVLLACTLLLGLCGAVMTVLAFVDMRSFDRLILTILLLAWVLNGMLVLVLHARAMLALATLLLLPLAAMWVQHEAQPAIAVLVLLMVFMGQYLFLRQVQRIVLGAHQVALTNRGLIDALRQRSSEAATRQFEAEQANQAKSRFLASASHDLRQPLHALSLQVALLRTQLQSERLDLVERIDASVQSLRTLFDSLLDLSRLDAGMIEVSRQPLDLSALLRRLCHELQPAYAGRGLYLDLNCPDRLWVDSDPVLLERVLRNGLENALHYTEFGGANVSAEEQGSWVRLSLRDTGPGIAPEDHQRVFQAFERLAAGRRSTHPGLGLGLPIVRRLSELLGTPCSLSSAPGEGTELSWQLHRLVAPVTQEWPRPAQGADAEWSLPFPGLRVLFVEDEVLPRQTMTELLQTWGCDVQAVGSIAQACSLFSALREAGNPEPFELLITDLLLTHEQHGLDLIDRLQQLGYAGPVLVITGDTSAEGLRRVRDSGFARLSKPASAQQIRDLIQALLDGSPLPGQTLH